MIIKLDSGWSKHFQMRTRLKLLHALNPNCTQQTLQTPYIQPHILLSGLNVTVITKQTLYLTVLNV